MGIFSSGAAAVAAGTAFANDSRKSLYASKYWGMSVTATAFRICKDILADAIGG
jgi:hypothetical protein